MKLHIELTNRCVLKCPACPRTEWQNILHRPVDKHDLDIGDLKKFLDCEAGRAVDQFLLCGDYGDSIYYPKLFDFLRTFRDTKKFNIVTNGSHRDEKFWHELSQILDERDTVTFAIDGLKDTNHIYRINSDWNSIMSAIDIIGRGRAHLLWKTIIFNYNYNQLQEIKQLAQQKGCEFVAEKTHRFGNDSLKPPVEFVENNHVFTESYITDVTLEIEPSCVTEQTVSCDGYLYPCDWIRNPRTLYKSQLWKQRDRWLEKLNIKKINLNQAMLIVEDWAHWVKKSSMEHSPLVDVLCRMKCRKGCQQNRCVSI